MRRSPQEGRRLCAATAEKRNMCTVSLQRAPVPTATIMAASSLSSTFVPGIASPDLLILGVLVQWLGYHVDVHAYIV